jgi:predicted transcriptional regulator
MLTNQSTVSLKGNRKRDRLAIVSSMLSCARGGVIKSKFMCEVGLSSAQCENYLSELLRSELLEITESQGRRIYRITRKGWIFLDTFDHLVSLLDSRNQVEGRLILPHEGSNGKQLFNFLSNLKRG